jgi:hypothetical protein
MELAALKAENVLPVFAVKVPAGYNWNNHTLADKFYIHVDQIFKMMLLLPLDENFRCLWALHMLITVDQNKDVAVAVPTDSPRMPKTIASCEQQESIYQNFSVPIRLQTIRLPYYPP